MGSPGRWANIIEPFYANARVSAKAGDEYVRVEYTAEVFLFDSVVLAAPGHSKVQDVAVELDAAAGCRRRRSQCGLYPEKASLTEPAISAVPSGGKVDQLQVMSIRVAKIECGNACRLRVPCGQGLRNVRNEARPRRALAHTPHSCSRPRSLHARTRIIGARIPGKGPFR